MRRLTISMLIFSWFVFCGVSARAGGLRIEILGDTEVRGDSIFLGNLLPVSAPRLIHEAADKISLGAAPQNGTTRAISRSAILSAIDTLGLPVSAFLIPEAIVVRRASHLVTREEVFEAIERALSKSSLPELPAVRLEDISLEAAVLVPENNPELEVTQITFDEFIGRARFRLWSKSSPAVHPFYVTAKAASDFERNAARPRAPLLPGLDARPLPQFVATPVLVETSHFASLYLHSTNSNMQLQVKPLQRGRLGDIIRVRLPSNGRTFLARVTGSGALEASF